jgi:hypothetical protein
MTEEFKMRSSRRRKSWAFYSAFCILHSAFLLASGCNIMGALAYKVVGPPVVEAKYKPPQEPLLVLVECYRNAGDLQSVSDELATAITNELTASKVAPMIDPGLVVNYRSAHPIEFSRMNIPEVGKTLGARQIIYVDLKHCEVTSIRGSDALNGEVEAKVRVVDVETGATRWPTTGDGEPFRDSTNFVRRDAADTGLAMRTQMVSDLAGAITRLFCRYKPDMIGPAAD